MSVITAGISAIWFEWKLATCSSGIVSRETLERKHGEASAEDGEKSGVAHEIRSPEMNELSIENSGDERDAGAFSLWGNFAGFIIAKSVVVAAAPTPALK